MNTWQSLKRRLVAWAMLMALALALLAPVRSAEAATTTSANANPFGDAFTPAVSWNSGPK